MGVRGGRIGGGGGGGGKGGAVGPNPPTFNQIPIQTVSPGQKTIRSSRKGPSR
jgi:hypothetical protein